MAAPQTDATTTVKAVQAGLLTWILPGAGHYLLGHRGLAAVVFVAITFPYLTGLALGGVMDFVNPRANRWLFLAELGVGGYTLPGYLVSQAVEKNVQERQARGEVVDETRYRAYYPESDIAIIYLATAGLLNILAILDAISRAQTGGLPTFHRELQPSPEPERGS